MEWNWLWESLIKYSGIIISAGFGGAIGTLIMEWLKSYWSKKNKEHEVIFTKYHENQSIVLAKLFSIISKLQRDIDFYLLSSSNGSRRDLTQTGNEILQQIISFRYFCTDNEIYLSDKIIEQIEYFLKLINDTLGDVMPSYPLHKTILNYLGEKTPKKITNNFIKQVWERTNKEFPILRSELKIEIKKILSTKVL